MGDENAEDVEQDPELADAGSEQGKQEHKVRCNRACGCGMS